MKSNGSNTSRDMTEANNTAQTDDQQRRLLDKLKEQTEVNLHEIAAVFGSLNANDDTELMTKLNCANSVKIANVNLDKLVIDNRLTRWHHTTLKQAVNRTFDMHLAGTIDVNYRDGKLYLMHGLHRCVTARVQGYHHMTAVVHENLTLQQQAEHFVKMHETTCISAHQRFQLSCQMDDKTAVTVKTLCDNYGLAIKPERTSAQKPCTLTAITTAHDIVKHYGPNCLNWVLETLYLSGWLHNTAYMPTATNNMMLTAIARAYNTGIALNDLPAHQAYLIQVLSRLSPTTLRELARTMAPTRELSSAINITITRIAMNVLTLHDIQNFVKTND